MADTTATKTERTIQSSVSNSAGGTTTSGAVDLSTALGMVVVGRITNGATGPTAGCAMEVQVSTDGSTWRTFSKQTAGTDDSESYDFIVELPAAVMQMRVVFEGNTDEAVTVEAVGHELTKLATS